MISPAREVACDLLCRIELHGAFSDFVLNSRNIAKLEGRDRNLVTEIVYGTLRWQAFVDFLLQQASSRPWEKISPEVRIILRMSLYQMWGMERIPDHALVHDAVELAKRRFNREVGGFVNGVLRRLSRERPWLKEQVARESPPWIRVSLPKWLWDRWSQRFGSEGAAEYALSLNQPPRRDCRLSRPSTKGNLTLPTGLEGGQPSELVPGAILFNHQSKREQGSLANSEFLIQDEASQLVPYLLGSMVGHHVWDVCAAPGGKSSIVADLCGPRGWVLSSDIRFKRALRLKQTLETRSGGRSHVVVLDATRPAPFRRRFDAVLADVPCSGLGTLRRNPEIKWRITEVKLMALNSVQRRILESVSDSVRPGGLLLYSTCSTEPEENEGVVESFLRTHSAFRLITPSSPPGIEAWLGPDEMMRTFPSSRVWDGFFAALMVRDD